ncbi:phosphate ABC transporter permease [Spiroplasma corruscae]|uniref:Phosphate ABC transporter permease n=1 Tax=Spiroplasma corruscae TaxID=216934 RepID=A0A222EN83_9MOLU|nr:phosphate ABC transporter permease PstA [Spiroplasma corruscae]ASP27966.1 phosphate ABC transporter permease [Spiroplasma corruscae]
MKEKHRSMKQYKTRSKKIDIASKNLIIFMTTIVILILTILISFILYKSVNFFKEFSFFKFIFSGDWSPGKDGASDSSYGIGRIIASTLMMLLISLIFAIPLTIFSSLFITEYLSGRLKKFVILFIQLLAGIPSVVFGLFAIDQIGPMFVKMGAPTGANMMTASLTLSFMALPTMIALSINAIEAVPEGHKYASLALGMTKERTTFSVVLVSASPKIVTAIITGIARIVGETMAVILIAGNSTRGLNVDDGFTGFLFSSIKTLAGTIGLEMLENNGSIHESSLYAIGLVLFFVVIIINLLIMAIGNISNSNRNRHKKNKKFASIGYNKNYTYNSHKLDVLVQTNTESRFRKKVHSTVLRAFMISSTAIIIGFISWILITVIANGLINFNYYSFVEITGQRSGIFALLLTTILLVVSTIIIAIPLSLFIALYLAEYAHKDSKFAKIIRFCINVLASTPSIVFGVFGLSLFVTAMGLPMSIFAASLTMTIVIMPTMITSFEDSITSVPTLYKEAAYGMGMSKSGVMFKVVIPNSLKGFMTTVILSVSRIIGESAPVYLTLGTAVRMPSDGFFSSGATLTTEIYMLASEGSTAELLGTAYQIAFVAILLVLGLIILSRYISNKLDPLHKNVTWKSKFINLYNSIFKFHYRAWFKKLFKNIRRKFKKLFRTISYKNIRIYYKNSRIRKKVIKDIIKDAKGPRKTN